MDKIGIIGCGHIGQAIATSLVKNGYTKNDILISYKGNPNTLEKIKDLGLNDCIVDNEKIFSEANIILITIKPQDISSLESITNIKNCEIVSCAAGVSISSLETILNTRVYRAMISGPDTIISGNGVLALYPYSEKLSSFFDGLKIKVYKLEIEEMVDVFTVGVCLPAAILQANNVEVVLKGIMKLQNEYPLLSNMYRWAKEVVPQFESDYTKNEYINHMCTRGGITEAIINSLKSGSDFDEAIKKGIARIKEISKG